MYTLIQCIIMCPSIYCDVCILKIGYNAICILLYNVILYNIVFVYYIQTYFIYKYVLFIYISIKALQTTSLCYNNVYTV